jgi:hypothetical protein
MRSGGPAVGRLPTRKNGFKKHAALRKGGATIIVRTRKTAGLDRIGWLA